MGSILELQGVSVTREGGRVLREVSVGIPEGATSVFMGGAGSGKSSLLKVAAGLVVPDSGKVLFRGKDLARMSRAEEMDFRGKSAFVFQDAALWSNQSLFDNLALPLRVHRPGLSRAEIDTAVQRAVDIVGFREELGSRPADLSTGEKRLVGLARALVLDPELLFLDEPAASLDEGSAERVYDILAQLRARGKSIVVVSGNSDFVSRYADVVGVVREGGLAAFGPYDEAVLWGGTGLSVETGRLRPRRKAGDSLAGDGPDGGNER
jgi:phospholipid/cholesterol/gamma-HCH transport system ATP-binding protein